MTASEDDPATADSAPGTSLARMLAILDLFTLARFEWTVEALSQALGYTASSTYRYVRELCRAGLLARMPGAGYVVGAKVIELEALIRRADPLAQAAQPILRELAQQTGCACLLSNVYGDRLVNVAHEPGIEQIDLTYLRGQPLPWFRGSPGKAALAFMPTARVRRLFELHGPHSEDPDAAWRACRADLRRVRQAGYSMSEGELDQDVIGFGVPLIPEADVLGSLSLACSRRRAEFLNHEGVGELLGGKARELEASLRERRGVVQADERESGNRRPS
jgi:DNA-binding IclR family transcriptional regulator